MTNPFRTYSALQPLLKATIAASCGLLMVPIISISVWHLSRDNTIVPVCTESRGMLEALFFDPIMSNIPRSTASSLLQAGALTGILVGAYLNFSAKYFRILPLVCAAICLLLFVVPERGSPARRMSDPFVDELERTHTKGSPVMKNRLILVFTIALLTLNGCKSNYEKLQDLNDEAIAVQDKLDTECTDHSMDMSSHFGGIYTTPGSPENLAWNKSVQAAQAHQAALDKNLHCRLLHTEATELAIRIRTLKEVMQPVAPKPK